MPSKKDLSEEINSLLPDEGGELDLTALKKDDLELLHKKLNLFYDQLLEGGGEMVDEIIVKKAKRVAKKRGADKEEQQLLGKFVDNRLKKGPLIQLGKKMLKDRLLDPSITDED